MRNAAIAIAGFVLGAASGAAGAWYILKTRYEQIAQEEIESVKEVYSRRQADANKKLKEQIDISKEDTDEYEPTEEDKQEYEGVVQRLDYSKFSAPEKEDEPAEKLAVKKATGVEKPYVITQEEFGENEDYEQIELIFYADKILADDNSEIIENVEEIIGFESLAHFDEETETVLVRNDRLKCDYEVVQDPRTYEEILEEKPYLRRGVL